MTSVPHGSFDAQKYAADLQAKAEQMYAQAMAQQAALRALGASVTSGPLTIKVGLAGRLDAFVLDEGAVPSASQLTQAFNDAYREGLKLVTSGAAQHSGGLDAVVAAYAPIDDEESTSRQPPRGQLDEVEGEAPVATIPVDDDFDRLLATLDEGEPEDISSFVNDPSFKKLVPAGDPSTWQSQLEQQVRAISAHASELTTLASQSVGEHNHRHLSIRVGTSGQVVRLLFNSSVSALPAEEVEKLVTDGYAAAAADAQHQFQAALAELGLGGADSPFA